MINLALIPQGKQTYFYNKDLVLQATLNEEASSALLAVTCCATVRGTVWVLYRNITSNASVLREFDLNTGLVINVLTTTLTLGEISGKHCLQELPNGNLLTVNYLTHDVIQISKVDASVVTTYSLNLNPYDAWLYVDGDTLFYVDGNIVKTFSLGSDSPISDFYDFGLPVIWPIISDSLTLYVYTGNFNDATGDILATDGISITQTYTGYTFVDGGLRGYCYIAALDRLYVFGYGLTTGGDQFSIFRFELSTGSLLDQTILTGPLSPSFPYANTTGAIIATVIPTVSNMTIDCATNIVTVTGVNFPINPVVLMQKDLVSFTDFTIESTSSTVITLHLPNFVNANYGVSVS